MSKYSSEEQRFRYEVRNEAEQSIKDLNIDRANFREAPKTEWERVIKRFYYTFIDYESSLKIHLEYLWLKFRSELKYIGSIQYGYHVDDWSEFVGRIDELIPKENRPAEYYYINDCGWVYEGKLPEIIRILGDCTGMVEDFYILPKRERFDWVVCYCGDGDSMGIYLRG
ncbi:MAG: hypothetical protein NC299_00975 [Lachnospiraceae bacterium]|nr:hypothetical protein [Ruminococcus sp.]MCM1273920.1 hypothetical protein [Lachnospiraceae bacterium]